MKNYIILGLLLCFFSCEEQMVVIPDIPIPATDRIVLVEEMTGVDCPNCPKGSAILNSLIAEFEGRVIGVGIHGDLLTKPISSSLYDFRTTHSQQIEQSFGIFAKPCAVINRTQFPDQGELEIYGEDTWRNYVQSELESEPKVDLTVTASLDEDTRTANISVNVTGREALTENLKISIVITEGNIVDAQKDQSEIIEEYNHKHVLRTMLTNWDGDNLSQGINVAQTLTKEYTFVVPEEDGLWKLADLDIVAFVTDPDGVLQAAEVHLKE